MSILKYALVIFAIAITTALSAQSSYSVENTSTTSIDCTNKLGAWIWYLRLTKFKNYEDLADSLSSLGIKRIYIKVADGKVDLNKWPELIDPSVPAIFAERGMEAWAWSYNYPGNEYAQADALYKAAKAGYKGYVIDIEAQFDGKPTAASKIMYQFDRAKKRAIEEKPEIGHFPVYCTTWGNPRSHRFPIATINQYVDAFMPQTYVENWGKDHIFTLESTIDNVNEEYRSMGCSKPIHHIVSTEKGVITANELNRFISYAGSETSVWPVPGVNTSLLLWTTWDNIDWNFNFCNTNREEYVANLQPDLKVNAHTSKNEIHVSEPVRSLQIMNNSGNVVAEVNEPSGIIDISSLVRGKYLMAVITHTGEKVLKYFYKN